MSIAIEEHTSKPIHTLCDNTFGIFMNFSSPCLEQFDLRIINLEMLNQMCCLNEIFDIPSHKLFASTQKSMMFFHHGKMKVVNKVLQANNLLQCNKKSRLTFSQGREDDANIKMIVTYGPTPCSFFFLDNGVLQNKGNDKTNDIFLYRVYTFTILYNLYAGYEKL
jgi:hypothetical protein